MRNWNGILEGTSVGRGMHGVGQRDNKGKEWHKTAYRGVQSSTVTKIQA